MAYPREGPRERESRMPRTARASGGAEIPVVLAAPNAGTPTADGSTGAFVVAQTITPGTLYWAVVTNGGSATDAQIIAGTGGNIVAGAVGNQAVTAAGKQTIATITGLASATTYQIKFLLVSIGGKNSAQVSVSLTTA